MVREAQASVFLVSHVEPGNERLHAMRPIDRQHLLAARHHRLHPMLSMLSVSMVLV